MKIHKQKNQREPRDILAQKLYRAAVKYHNESFKPNWDYWRALADEVLKG